ACLASAQASYFGHHSGAPSRSAICNLGGLGAVHNRTLRSKWFRRLAPALLALSAFALGANAQQPAQGYPGAAPRNPACIRLEGQLTTLDRGVVDPAAADQIKRLEDSANKQQAELDRLTAQARRIGCEGRGFFSLFSGQPQQCGPLNNQIQQQRASLDRVLGEI